MAVEQKEQGGCLGRSSDRGPARATEPVEDDSDPPRWGGLRLGKREKRSLMSAFIKPSKATWSMGLSWNKNSLGEWRRSNFFPQTPRGVKARQADVEVTLKEPLRIYGPRNRSWSTGSTRWRCGSK
ncbi:uncharacterized protein A4U43_C05F16630 [Asparagus officinalis]|uniref:Uncharacterized protein n=1 Tax=Asparagus officinalis TaxID=4686 RepID=A0A5P1EUL6_ASPOF|nr:uncharacterized protein A4U43_C05F16630 [Asparagus officinalis]